MNLRLKDRPAAERAHQADAANCPLVTRKVSNNMVRFGVFWLAEMAVVFAACLAGCKQNAPASTPPAVAPLDTSAAGATTSAAVDASATPVVPPARPRLGGGYRGIPWGATVDQITASRQATSLFTEGTPYTGQQLPEGSVIQGTTRCWCTYTLTNSQWTQYLYSGGRTRTVREPPHGLLTRCPDSLPNDAVCVGREGGSMMPGVSREIKLGRGNGHSTLYLQNGRLAFVNPEVSYTSDADYTTLHDTLVGQFGPPTRHLIETHPREPPDYRYQVDVWDDGETIITLTFLPHIDPVVYNDSVYSGGHLSLKYESAASTRAAQAAVDTAGNAEAERRRVEAERRAQELRNSL